MNFTHLLFDFDNTLVDFTYSAHKGLQDTFKEYKIDWNEKNYNLYKKINHGVWSEFEQGLITTEDIRKKRFALFLKSLNMQNHDGYEMNAFFLERIVDHPKILKHTIETLDLLQDNFTLGIVTNGLKEVQRRRITKHGLDSYFTEIVVSDEIDLAKPDPRYFQYTLDRIEEKDKSKVLVVGDNITSDVGGAQAFGFKACWFNPDDKENQSDTLPFHQIEKLTELTELLSIES